MNDRKLNIKPLLNLIILIIIILVIFFSDYRKSVKMQLRSKELYSTEIVGKINLIRQNRGTVSLVTNEFGNIKKYYFNATYNEELNPSNLVDFAHPNDSIYKAKNSYILNIYRNRKVYQFELVVLNDSSPH